MPTKEKWRIKKKPERVFKYKEPSKGKKGIPKYLERYGRKYKFIGKYPTVAQAEKAVKNRGLEPFVQIIFEKGVTRYLAYGAKPRK